MTNALFSRFLSFCAVLIIVCHSWNYLLCGLVCCPVLKVKTLLFHVSCHIAHNNEIFIIITRDFSKEQ